MAIDRIRVDEGATYVHAFTPTGAEDIAAARLTLYDVETYDPSTSPTTGILNGREGQDVFNVNGVVIDDESDELVTWTIAAADNTIVTGRRQIERHRAEFTFTLADASILRYQCEIEVKNLRGSA